MAEISEAILRNPNPIVLCLRCAQKFPKNDSDNVKEGSYGVCEKCGQPASYAVWRGRMEVPVVPLPIIMGKRITRAEVMEGLRDGYKSMVTLAKQEDSSTVGFPDMVTLLDHIEEHGLLPKGME